MFPAIEPSEVGHTGLAWLFLTYGFVLYYASNLISEGSDLLLLVPSMASFVGGTVLPLLGAVPDGAILLFSGLGDLAAAQESLSVGVGALAGSTVMLLTIPWGLSVIAGRVDLVGPYKTPNYMGKPTKLTITDCMETLMNTGVALTTQVYHGAIVMMITTLPYFLIQIPASVYESKAASFSLSEELEYVGHAESRWALSGFCICIVGFISYLAFQVRTSRKGADKLRRIQVMKRYVYRGLVSLSGCMMDEIEAVCQERKSLGVSENQPLQAGGIPKDVKEELAAVLRDSFRKYDEDHNGTLEPAEFKDVLRDLSESVSEKKLKQLFDKYDTDQDGTICFDEFLGAIWQLLLERVQQGEELHLENLRSDVDVSGEHGNGNGEEAEEELPEKIANLPPEEQQRAIKQRAFLMLVVGTALVVLFSDPMVDVLSEMAGRLHVSAFYVSFVLAPLASNASEVIASQFYAAKKTRKTMTVSLTALEGAASMNNTFCLSILLGLIYFRGLVWMYTAETISILIVQYCVGVMAIRNSTMTVLHGLVVISLFPLSIALVAILEKLGLD